MGETTTEGLLRSDEASGVDPQGEFAGVGLREDIRLSWQRSRQALAPTDKLEVPYAELDDNDHRLLRAIDPVLAQFAQQLGDSRFSLVLADRDGRVVRTWAGQSDVRRHMASLSVDEGFVLSEECAGTNGIGTVLEERRPVLVAGEEHYSETLKHLTCAGMPIHNPVTGRLEGVLDLACPENEWSQLVFPALAQLRHDVEHELASKVGLAQRIFFERFTARCRETSAAVIGVTDQYMLTNAAAADLLSAADQGVLWTVLSRNDCDGGTQSITLSNGSTLDATSHVIALSGSVGGRLVELSPPVRETSRSPRARTSTTAEARLGAAVESDCQRLLILGEPGSGKATAAERVQRRLDGDCAMTAFSCELSRVADGRVWLAELSTRLDEARGTVLLRHLDMLDEPTAQAVAALLGRGTLDRRFDKSVGSRAIDAPGPRVIATATDGFRRRGAAALLEAFGEQTVDLPALRDRRRDLGTLVASLLESIDPTVHVTGRAMAALQNYDWPGNITQLRDVLAQAASAANGRLIALEHLPAEVAGSLRGHQALSRMEELEREAIIAALREQRGNKVRAAQALGLSRSTFYRRLRQLRLDPSTLLD